MLAAMVAEAVPTGLFVVGVAGALNWQAEMPLDGLDRAVDDLVLLLNQHSDVRYGANEQEALHGGNRNDLVLRLDKWCSGPREQRFGVLVWSGHATVDNFDNSSLLLVTDDSDYPNPDADTSLQATILGDKVLRSEFERVVVILDTCHSGLGAAEVAELAIRPWRGSSRLQKSVTVVSSCLGYQDARNREFLQGLQDVLRTGSSRRRWTPGDRFIDPYDLVTELNERFRPVSARQMPDSAIIHPAGPCIPNPMYNPTLAMRDHFLLLSRGVESEQQGWLFSGRRRQLQQIVEWIRQDDSGVLVVTGPPGAGTSAILGRVVVLSDPDLRNEAARIGALMDVPPQTDPGSGSISAAIHAARLSLQECTSAIASALHLGAGVGGTDELIDAIREADIQATIVFDALEEAREPRVIAQALIRQLGALPRVHVLVGTRSEDALLQLLRPARVIDLGRVPEAELSSDIASYARGRLASQARYRDNQYVLEEFASAIVARARGNFLFARVLTRWLLDQDEIHRPDELPTTIDDAIQRDLDRYGPDRRRIEDMLAGLAWGEGSGVPRRHWAEIAGAVSGRLYTEDDIEFVLERAGRYVIESAEGGQTVYSLLHTLVVDYFKRVSTRGQR